MGKLLRAACTASSSVWKKKKKGGVKKGELEKGGDPYREREREGHAGRQAGRLLARQCLNVIVILPHSGLQQQQQGERIIERALLD
jgi:hypothetical protein